MRQRHGSTSFVKMFGPHPHVTLSEVCDGGDATTAAASRTVRVMGKVERWAEALGPLVYATAGDPLPLATKSGRVLAPLHLRGIAGVPEVLSVLPDDLSPWTVAAWLLTPDPDGRAPVDRLVSGHVSDVVADARSWAVGLAQ
jgi:hypothetical protein